ncbi:MULTISPECIES: YjaA family stress response protein [unclassified Brenneria]|uniref:YjaA family stress response protein n=1 Tax=unclassified Brenneria TaxID=2634434 RepID=UPI0029C2413F|nr:MULTISPECIES: YjaA family stress response protein [unclassified Brenneria]MDX5630313.1 YjaA family stress response protein [Brenneria sp. L3-3Z]MDX5697458.1 YjaA family stress response protein [Brenneria sp. L4-2C]MEE3660856.1 YjaA family stress response protein [Brenneria sp. g21c3]
MSILYIQIRKNKMIVRNPETHQEVSDASQVFSNSRLLVADFFRAQKVLYDLSRRLVKRSWFKFGRDTLIIHALEMNEGGLSPVEERVLQEITVASSPKAYLMVIDSPRVLADSEVIERAKEKR